MLHQAQTPGSNPRDSNSAGLAVGVGQGDWYQGKFGNFPGSWPDARWARHLEVIQPFSLVFPSQAHALVPSNLARFPHLWLPVTQCPGPVLRRPVSPSSSLTLTPGQLPAHTQTLSQARLLSASSLLVLLLSLWFRHLSVFAGTSAVAYQRDILGVPYAQKSPI